jgi:type IV pilus assembly protein PilA
MQREHLGARAAQQDETGFTLIELMMVVLIIGILIAVLIPVFIGASTRAKDRVMQANLKTALTAAKGVYNDKLDYTQATPGALLTYSGASPFNFVASAVAPAKQNTVSVDAVNAAYIVLGGQSKSGTCFYVSDDETTGTTLYAHMAGAGGCAANGAPLVGDPSWAPSW